MKVGKWVLGLAALGLLFIGTADAQTVNANTLCIHSGGGYYVNGPFYGYPNHGGGKYFPSFAHIPSTSVGNAGVIYAWKIAGWAWIGMQANSFGPTWVWHNCLQFSTDSPYATTMSWSYPVLFCNGTLPVSGPPTVIVGRVPSSLPIIGDYLWIFPSSAGGFDAYLNIFAIGSASWYIPSTLPFYGWSFGLIAPCASAITLPSNDSIWQFHWVMKGPFGQYLVLSEEDDCAGHTWAGNKGRNYSLISDADNGYFWYWNNGGKGVGEEWAECLWVCDSILIPVNAPGYQSPSWNPFYNYGFDVGAATLTPYLSSQACSLGFMTQSYNAPAGDMSIALAAFSFWPPIPYGKGYRLPHGYDVITAMFIGIAPLFAHMPAPGYPACMFGTTVGANSLILPFPPYPGLLCAEWTFSGYQSAPGGAPPTAGYHVTFF